jgi:hypothetical protein
MKKRLRDKLKEGKTRLVQIVNSTQTKIKYGSIEKRVLVQGTKYSIYYVAICFETHAVTYIQNNYS